MSNHNASKSAEPAEPATDTTKTCDQEKEPEEPVNSRPDMFNNKDYSDVTVHCGDKVWHCHQAILFPRCPPLKDLMKTDGADRKITLPNECVIGAEQMLTYIYSEVLPIFLPIDEKEDHEIQRNEIWVQSSQAYLNGVKYQLEPLKDAGLEAALVQAPKLCKYWDKFSADMRQRRFEMISQVWTDWDGPEMAEIMRVRLGILKGLVRYTAQIVLSPLLHDLLKQNEGFMLDYMWMLSKKVSEQRSRGLTLLKFKSDALVKTS